MSLKEKQRMTQFTLRHRILLVVFYLYNFMESLSFLYYIVIDIVDIL